MKKIMIAFAWTVCVLTACDKNKPSQTEMQALPVDVAKPLVENVTLTKDYPGYLEAESNVDLVGRVNGTLQSKNFAPGSRVRQGQVLFVIEPTLYENSVKQAEAELKTAKANLEYAVSSYQRMKEAIKSDAVSRIQYLQAESHVAACEAAVSNAEAALKTARTNLSYCYVKAPCDGVVDVSAYSVGAYIGGALQPVKLATVYKDNRMYSYFNIADNQYLTYELAQEAASKIPAETHFVTLRLGTDGAQSWKAKLDYLSPNVTLTNTAFRASPYGKVTLTNNPGRSIPSGLSNSARKRRVPVVNDSDIVNYRHIEVGQLADHNMRVVKSGLSPSERYVTKALLKVRQGMKIKPIEQTNKLQ